MNASVSKKIADFFSNYPTKEFQAKEIIVHAGDDPAGIMYLVSGEVRQYDITSNGDEVVVNVFKPPAFFPMSWAINSTPNQYFFETISETKMHLCPPGEAIDFIKTNPDVAYDLLSRIYSGLDGMLLRTTHLMKGSGYTRTLLELLIAVKRFGTKTESGFNLSITETDLATRSGLTRETISRELKKLQDKGIIKVGHKNIEVFNIEKIEEELSNN